jgi:hypothetical protein
MLFDDTPLLPVAVQSVAAIAGTTAVNISAITALIESKIDLILLTI